MEGSPSLDDLWDYEEPAASEGRFRQFLSSCTSPDEASECKTQIARALGLQRKFDEAHEWLDEVAAEMEAGSRVEVRYMLERGRTINSSGGRIASRQVFHQAVEAANNLGDDGLAADAMHMVAIVEDGEDSLNWNLKTLDFCESSPDPKAKKWLASLYNNTGWSLFELSRFDEALSLFQKAQVLRERRGDVRNEQIARWCIARCLRAMAKNDEALAIQIRLYAEVNGRDQYVNEELAELYSAKREPAKAAQHAEAAYRVLSADPWFVENEPARLERLRSLTNRPRSG